MISNWEKFNEGLFSKTDYLELADNIILSANIERVKKIEKIKPNNYKITLTDDVKQGLLTELRILNNIEIFISLENITEDKLFKLKSTYKLYFDREFDKIFNVNDENRRRVYKSITTLNSSESFNLESQNAASMTMFVAAIKYNEIKGELADNIEYMIRSTAYYIQRSINEISNRISSIRKAFSDAKRKTTLMSKISDIEDIFNDLSDISADHNIKIDGNRLHAQFAIKGLRSDRFTLSKSGYASYHSYTANVDVEESKLILNEKLLEIFDILAAIRPRLIDLIPDLKIKISISRDNLEVIGE